MDKHFGAGVKTAILIFLYNIQGFFRSRGLMQDNNSLRLERLRNRCQGKRCFLIGNGYGLTGEELERLQGEYTFGVDITVCRTSGKEAWQPAFHCVTDAADASGLGAQLAEMPKVSLVTTKRAYRQMKKKPVNTIYVRTLPCLRYRVRGNLQAYCREGADTLSLAAEFAFHMGFGEIYLLGAGGRMTDRALSVYSRLDRYAAKHGIRIYNAGCEAAPEIFPQVKLTDILNRN